MRYTTAHWLAGCISLMIAGVALVTLPQDVDPPIRWKIGFGLSEWFIGSIGGMVLGVALSRFGRPLSEMFQKKKTD